MVQREERMASARPHRSPEGPVRTCIGCRKRELAANLLRVVAVDGGNGANAVIVDAAGSLPGRGAWLHPDSQCTRAAVRRRAFGRALRITGSPDTSAVVGYVEGTSSSESLDVTLAGSAVVATDGSKKNMSTP